MLFPTATFAAFFAVVLAGAWALAPRPTARKLWLIAAGAVFYGWWDTRFVLLLAAVIVANWAFARLLDRTRSQAVLVAGIAVDLGALALFKYYGFFTDSLVSALDDVGLRVSPPLLALSLPVGISFYVFQCVSYLLDVSRSRLAPAALLDVATWLAFFPTLTSGPITRATEFLPQLAQPPVAADVDTARAYWLIARGLVKKLVVASYLSTAITDATLRNPNDYSSAVLLIAVYAYAVQIYVDFSGYTDLALGLAALLGFTLPANFDRPYAATSIQDFWSRWHMTLSRWLRDYLFAPITGRRNTSALRVYGGILAVMLLAGLWHGAAWGFVVFGGVHGLAMIQERWRRERRRRLHRPVPKRTWRRQLVRRVATFHIVCLGWVFFATSSVAGALDVLRGIATNGSTATAASPVTSLLLLTVLAVLALQYLPEAWASRALARARTVPLAAQGAALGLALVPILALAPTSVPAFIYYRF